MGRLTPDEFRQKYAALPPNLREAYSSLDTTKILEEIGKKHGLLIDQIGELVNETGFLMLGATPPGEYIGKLSAAIGIPREKAQGIAVDVNERVFKPIRDALKQVHKVGESSIPPQKTEFRQAAPAITPSPQPPAPSSQPPARTLADDVRRATNAPEGAPFSPPKNLSEERLTKTFSIPHQEKSYSVSDTGEEGSPPKHEYQIDPYREPTD